MPDELSPRQAAERMGTTTRSVQRWIASGLLPARRLGGRWRVASDAIDAFNAVQEGDTRHVADKPPATASIRHLFVANRGEIARRIAATARRRSIEVTIPGIGASPEVDLLDLDAVVAAALEAGSDALHPGYGFLAENPRFAEAVTRAGLRWVGPPPEAIAAMGDKAAARRLAAATDVPVVPGYDGEDQSDEALRAAAGRIGLPLLVKPAAGGGGKGMRTVRIAAELDAALAAARREATAAFSITGSSSNS